MEKAKYESGVPGVFWEIGRETWHVSITKDGKKTYLGRRKKLEDAIQLRRDAETGKFPTEDERNARTPEQIEVLFNKMARMRTRAVWRGVTKGCHGWKSFDDFIISVGDRPKVTNKLVAKDESLPIGPDNFQWVKPEFDFTTKEGRNRYLKAHRAKNPMMYKDKDLRNKFGKEFGVDAFKKKLEEQGGVCAICKKPERGTRNGVIRWLNVDHNHETNAVRGLLCTSCNVSVGMMYENRSIMIAAMDYLDKWDHVEADKIAGDMGQVNGSLSFST